nr:MAG TPA: hypothetical protein [Caudoviricetes sp.]
MYNIYNEYYIFIYSCIKSTKYLYEWGGSVQNNGAGTARNSSQIQLKIS